MALNSCIRSWLTFFSLFCFCVSSNPIMAFFILPANITVFGDAFVSFNPTTTVTLTKEHNCTSPATSLSSSGSSISGVGRAFYMKPIRFLDPSTHKTSSFICKFSFSITPPASCPFGDGFAFLITSNKDSFSLDEGHMGLPKLPLDLNDSLLAVEFDTGFDIGLDDINGNHIGIDLNSMRSMAAVSDVSSGIDLKGGETIEFTTWIEYNNSRKMIQVFVSRSRSSHHLSPKLLANVDLSMHFKEFMHIGFSASNGNGSAIYTVNQWSFETFGSQSSSSSSRHESSGFYRNQHVWVLGLTLAFVSLAVLTSGVTAAFLAVRRIP